MPKRYRPREVIRVLESLGWQLDRQRGSHAILVKEGEKNNVSVPVSRREVSNRTFGNILRQSGVRRREFDQQADEVL